MSSPTTSHTTGPATDPIASPEAREGTVGRIPRPSARLLPVDPDGRVLLLRTQDPAHPGHLTWIPSGGGLDDGESLPEAAVRELREETGLEVSSSDVVGPVHEGEYPFSFNGTDYLAQSTFFACPLPADSVVSFAGLDALEVDNVVDWGWWTPEDLRADGGAAEPDLPEVMAAAVAAVRASEAS